MILKPIRSGLKGQIRHCEDFGDVAISGALKSRIL